MKDHKPLGVGILGAGPVTQAIHLPTLKRLPQFDVVHVMDIDADVANAVAARADAEASTTATDVMGDPRVEVVAICSPPAFHAAQVLAAIDAGKRGILCEKPFATSREEAMELADVAQRNGVPIVVGAMHTYDPAWDAVSAQWDRLGSAAHSIRSSIVLPMNSRFEGLGHGDPPPCGAFSLRQPHGLFRALCNASRRDHGARHPQPSSSAPLHAHRGRGHAC